MEQKEFFILLLLSLIGITLITGCIVFIQHQTSKVAVMSTDRADKPKPAATTNNDRLANDDNSANLDNSANDKIKNFEECAAAGYPVEEIYPAQCFADGKSFTENIGNEMELLDLIKIYSPRPNARIASPSTISGQARGKWFFEADFPVKLFDENNNEIGRGSAQAQSDWMTEDFVEFLAVIEFDAPTTATGTLILEKNNPSGLPEHNNQLIVPVKF
jgi:Immunoglobulin-like domain of bacterial spore germination.